MAIEDEARLWLAGDDAPCAYVEASVFANEGHMGYRAFSAEVAAAFAETLGIAPECVYVRYADIPAWSVADMVADRRLLA